jgi:hypothetical protein
MWHLVLGGDAEISGCSISEQCVLAVVPEARENHRIALLADAEKENAFGISKACAPKRGFVCTVIAREWSFEKGVRRISN